METSVITNDINHNIKFNLKDFDRYVLESHLKSKINISDKSYASSKTIIFNFLNKIKKNLDKITEIDCRNYFDYIDSKISEYTKRRLALSSKNQYRSVLNQFFNIYELKYKRKYREFYLNPILTKDEYKFQRVKSNQKEKIFTQDELIDVLKKTKRMGEKYFVFHCLLIFCGMRSSECASIRLEDIHLIDRYLKTGTEKNCRKSNSDLENPLVFIFPNEIKIILFEYISYLKKISPNAEYLFPLCRSTSSVPFFSEQSFRQALIRNKIHTKLHDYRKTLITNLTKDENGKPNLYRAEYLTNHKISGATAQHYVKFSIKQRRELYDVTMKNKYLKIKKWLKNN